MTSGICGAEHVSGFRLAVSLFEQSLRDAWLDSLAPWVENPRLTSTVATRRSTAANSNVVGELFLVEGAIPAVWAGSRDLIQFRRFRVRCFARPTPAFALASNRCRAIGRP